MDDIASAEKKRDICSHSKGMNHSVGESCIFGLQIRRRCSAREQRQWFFHSSKMRPSHYIGRPELYSLSQLEMNDHFESSEYDFTRSPIIKNIHCTITSVIGNLDKLFTCSHLFQSLMDRWLGTEICEFTQKVSRDDRKENL